MKNARETRGLVVAILASVLTLSAAAEMKVRYDGAKGFVEVSENGSLVLRYNHGTTDVPAGIGPEYARGDYIHPLYGLSGETLTDDYPKDHAHHRGVNWAWATLEWRGEMRDMFAVRGAWARPVDCQARIENGAAIIEEESVWKWDDKEPIANERVRICVQPATDAGRFIDFDIALHAVVDGLRFCGRIEEGYSGFNARMAPAKGQQIRLHVDPADAKPRRAWADYSAAFSGANGTAGLSILQSANNPLYPSEWRQYPSLNFFQPAFPGGAPINLPKDPPIVLHYRLWIHRDAPDEETLARQWDAYNAETARGKP